MTDPGRAIPGYPNYRVHPDGTIRRAIDGARIHPVHGEVTLIDHTGRFHRHPMTELMALLNTPTPPTTDTTKDSDTMATQLIDDLDHTAPAETITFSLEGTHYEVDLAPHNRDALRELLDQFIVVARRRPGGHRRRATLTGTTSRAQRARAIREWARTNGYDIADQGRIPNAVVEAYDRHHPKPGDRAPAVHRAFEDADLG